MEKLSDAKVGDTVIRVYRAKRYPVEVRKVTPKRLHVRGGIYIRETGLSDRRSGNGGMGYIEAPWDGEVAAFEQEAKRKAAERDAERRVEKQRQSDAMDWLYDQLCRNTNHGITACRRDRFDDIIRAAIQGNEPADLKAMFSK